MKILSVLLIAMVLSAGVALGGTRCHTDMVGKVVCQEDAGTWRGYTDPFGNQTWRNDRGDTWRGYSDPFGNQTWRNDRGDTVRCYTDSFGNTTCR